MLMIGVGMFLRAYQLSYPSLWQDEAFTWRMSRFSCREIVGRTARDTNPPFYYIALHLWESALGSSVGAMRCLSVVCGLAGIVLIHGFASELERARVSEEGPWRAVAFSAALAAALAAVCPFLVAHDREARMYALGCLLATASGWALWRALQRPGAAVGAWAAHAVTASALLYAHSFGLFTVAAQAIYALGHIVHQRRRGDPSWRANAVGACGAFLAIGLLYAPWAPVMLEQNRRVAESFWTSSLDLDAIAGAVEQIFTGSISTAYPRMGHTALLVIAAVLALLLAGRSAAGSFLAALIGVPIALSIAASLIEGRNIVVGRCLAFTVPFLIVAIARLAARLPKSSIRWGVAVLLIVNAVAVQGLPFGVLRIGDRPGLRAAVGEVLKGYRAGDGVFCFDNGGEHLAMCYYARGRFRPVVLLRHGRRPRHYHGAAVLSNEELLEVQRLDDERGPARVWLLLAGANRSRRLMFDHWKLVWSKTFAESAPYREGDVDIDLWVRKEESVLNGDKVLPAAGRPRQDTWKGTRS